MGSILQKEELGSLIKDRIGVDVGVVEDLIPLERGTSGRIVRLRIVGSKKTLTIGKELLIRKALSPSHLYSSAFVPVKRSDGFILYGAGWGHGAGFCQIGAAVMADRGYIIRKSCNIIIPVPGLKIVRMKESRKRQAKCLVLIPTLYFAQGLPYVAVMTIAVIMYKRLGLSNTEIALYTSWLYLPWVIKPIWSPFVDLIKTKRLWVVLMQSAVAVGFAGVAFFIPTTFFLKSTLAFFWLIAFSSATHDIAADGFYMLALTQGEQSFFVGIRNTFYRFATIFGQGLLVMLAGYLEEGKIIPSLAGKIPLAWSLSFYFLAAIFIILTLYHQMVLPRPAADVSRDNITPVGLLKDFFQTFVSFFRKKDLALIFFFILTYRLGESQLVKIATPFLLDTPEAGGLGLPTATVGMVYGTIGVIALLLGGIIGGIAVSRGGLKKWIIPMALAINLPDLLYVYMASAMPDNIYVIIPVAMGNWDMALDLRLLCPI